MDKILVYLLSILQIILLMQSLRRIANFYDKIHQ